MPEKNSYPYIRFITSKNGHHFVLLPDRMQEVSAEDTVSVPSGMPYTYRKMLINTLARTAVKKMFKFRGMDDKRHIVRRGEITSGSWGWRWCANSSLSIGCQVFEPAAVNALDKWINQ